MSGGNLTSQRRRCAHRWGAGLLGTLLISPCGVALAGDAEDATSTAAASASSTAADCAVGPAEQSIVIQKQKSAAGESDVVIASDQSGGGLEPIANASDYEPELADAPAAPAPAKTPTLADPPTAKNSPAILAGRAPAVPATETTPATDDVCVEETVATDAAEAVPAHAASFNGVTPGVTTRDQLHSQWGEPKRTSESGDELTYELQNFPTVAVTCVDDQIDSIRVELLEPADCRRLAVKLGLAAIRPAQLEDDNGIPTATSYPERGVTLNHAPTAFAANQSPKAKSGVTTDIAYELVIRPITAEAFVARAACTPARDYAHRIHDLQTALELDATNAQARFMLSECKLAAGAVVEAEELAAVACELEPRNDQYRLQWAKCLKYLAKYDQAVEQTRLVLEGATASKLVRAYALEQMALLAALGSKEVQERAVPLHHKAIELANELVASEDAAARTAANLLLVDAHLAIAERIAVGEWQNKEAAVAEWIARASSLAEEMIAAGEADVSLRLQVALTGLVAGGRLDPPIDPAPWITEAEQAAADLEGAIVDGQARDELNWQLGLAYYHATEIQHRRGQAESALRFGKLAETTLSPLAASRSDLPDTDYLLGRLRFQIGAIHAVHHKDHDLACQWYDKSYDSLMRPVPLTAIATPGHHGDALVSMGVSYWEIGSRDRAYELTQAGVTLVTQGVTEGLLANGALAVPKGNLAAMSKALNKLDLESPPTSAPKTQVAQAPQQRPKRSAQSNQSTQQQRQTRTATRRNSDTGSTTRR